MSFATYAEIKQKVEQDLDLEDEDFIEDDEMMGYCNEGISEAESIILKNRADYFLDSHALSLVSGTATYDLPSDIYGDKIRKIIYANGSRIYPIKRLKYEHQFENLAWANYQPAANPIYEYMVTNDLTDGRKINIFPTPAESGDYCTIWYLRNARQVTASSDVVDIPEFRRFIEQFMKVRCYEKEGHGPKYQAAVQALAVFRQNMIESLSDRFADDENKLELDMSFYEEHL